MSILEWSRSVLDLVFPRQCQECGETCCPRYSFLCDPCSRNVPRLEPPFCEVCAMPFSGNILGEFQCPNCLEMKVHYDKVYSLLRFRGIVRKAIHDFKYSGRIHWRKVLQDWILEGLNDYPELKELDGIVPVPLHPVRRRERGFNQAEVLAEAVGRSLHVERLFRILKRIRSTETQTHLDREERLNNLRGAFKVSKIEKIRGKKILLVDDVLTTGSTVSECAGVLKKEGATSVLVLTLARG